MKTRLVLGLLLFCTACYDPDDFELDEDLIDEIVLLHIPQEDIELPADGSSSLAVTASLSPDASKDKRVVIFTTTKGKFINSESGLNTAVEAVATPLSVNGRLEAQAVLRSDTKAGTALITASASGILANDTVRVKFIRAYPEALDVILDSISLAPSFQRELILKGILSRSKGNPTAGHPVNFDVVGEDGRSVGFFVNNVKSAKTNEDGVASLRYTLGSDPVGINEKMTVKAAAQVVIEGDTITATAVTYFVVDN